MKGMRNVWLAALALVLLGGVAACAGNEKMMEKDMDSKEMEKRQMAADNAMESMEMEKDKMGAMLMGAEGHHASGKVEFGMGMNDTHKLILRDIEVDKVPDGRVYLAKDADHMNGVEVGKLKQFTGTVSFDLPAGVDPADYNSVVIWCKQFNVEIGRAFYGPKMM